MSVIYNFNELSESELQAFAAGIVEKINSESILTSDVNFKIYSVEADDMTGDLAISLTHDGLIEVPRPATWQCANEEDRFDDPDFDAEYDNKFIEDLKNSFKTLKTTIDGYDVEVDIDDYDDEETVEVDVDSYSEEDAGIGRYEYWGEIGYDSRPYVEVEGTVVRGCSCAITIYISPAKE
jgi:hypothetical protein